MFFGDPESRVGTALTSKWTLDAVLGAGGMGTVFAATHRNGVRRAIKVMHACAEGEFRERFLREARVASQIEHPGRVKIEDDDVSDEGELYLVMELLDGCDLWTHQRQRGGKLPFGECLDIVRPVLELLRVCHAQGIIHRDIKPANIFLTRAGAVKVLDFGIAHLSTPDQANELTSEGALLGSPGFMSPEQALGFSREVTGASDVFSVGACLYTLVTGQYIHQEMSAQEKIIAIATKQVPSLALVAPDVPAAFVAFVDRALALDAAHRYQDAGEMLAALGAAEEALAQAPQGQNETGARVRGAIIEDAPAATANKGLVGALWQQLNQALAEAHHVGWSHTSVLKSLGKAEALFGSLRRDDRDGAIVLDVKPSGFDHEQEAVWAPGRAPFDRVPYGLFADGIRRLKIDLQAPLEELTAFLQYLQRVAYGDISPEDDTVTVLTALGLKHVTYEAIESLVKNEDERRIVEGVFKKYLHYFDVDLAMSNAVAARQAGLSQLLRDAWQLGSYRELAPAPDDALTEEELEQKLTRVLEAAYVEDAQRKGPSVLLTALTSWTRARVVAGEARVVLEIAHALLGGLAQLAREEGAPSRAALAGLLREALLGHDTVASLLTELKYLDELSEPLVERLAAALRDLPGPTLIVPCVDVLDHLAQRELCDAIEAYLFTWADGREAEWAQLALARSEKVGLLVARVLGKGKGASQLALEHLLIHPAAAVRMEALALMEDNERALTELKKRFEQGDEAERLELLKFIAGRKLKAAGPLLALRVRAETFGAYSDEERQQSLHALYVLSPAHTERVVSEVLAKRSVLGRAKLEALQAGMLDLILSHSFGERVKIAVEALSSDRLRVSSALREKAKATLSPPVKGGAA